MILTANFGTRLIIISLHPFSLVEKVCGWASVTRLCLSPACHNIAVRCLLFSTENVVAGAGNHNERPKIAQSMHGATIFQPHKGPKKVNETIVNKGHEAFHPFMNAVMFSAVLLSETIAWSPRLRRAPSGHWLHQQGVLWLYRTAMSSQPGSYTLLPVKLTLAGRPQLPRGYTGKEMDAFHFQYRCINAQAFV